MNKSLTLFFLLALIGCESSHLPTEPPPSVAESDFKVHVVPAVGPNIYLINFEWARVPQAGLSIYQVFSGQTSKVLEVNKYGGTAVKAINNAPGTYLYFLGRDPNDRTLEVKVEVPKDFDGRETIFPLDQPVNLSGYARVFLKDKIRVLRPIIIQADEIRLEGLVTLDAGGPTEPAPPGENGKDGQNIFVSVKRLVGDLRLTSVGQPGGPLDKNGRQGTRGTSGKIECYAAEKTDSYVTVWLKNDWQPQRSRCGPYSVKIGVEAAISGNCTTVDQRLSGVYFIAPDLYYLHPHFGLTLVKERKEGISLIDLGMAASYDEGMTVTVSHRDSGPPEYLFGLVRNGFTQQGSKKAVARGSAQLMHFITLTEKFSELYEDYKRRLIPLYLYYDNKETIDPLVHSPWNAIAKLTESRFLFAPEMLRNQTGAVLRISKKTSLEKNHSFIHFSGNVPVDDEQVIELVRKQ